MQESSSINSEKKVNESDSLKASPSGGGLEGVIIRKAEIKDCKRMMELVHELAVYEKEPDAVTVSFDHFVESGFGEKPVWWAYVAEIPAISSPTGGDRGGLEVVGFALWYIRYSTWTGQRLYLEDILVTEKMRGKGIGKMLFDTLLKECRENQYSGMVWQVLSWNKPAINFYKKYQDVALDENWLNGSIAISRQLPGEDPG